MADKQEPGNSMKKQRDTDRAKMIADMKAKAKKANYKAKPSFEILDMPETERERGQKVAEYQARKEEQKQSEREA